MKNRTIEQVFIENKEISTESILTSVSPFDYIDRGKYINFLRPYFELFPGDSIGIYFYEEFITNYAKVQQLYQFLNVNHKFSSPYSNKRINSSNTKEKISDDIYFKLKEVFRDYNSQLEQFMGIDISIWNSR